MAETAAQREARMNRALEGRGRGEPGSAPARRASQVRTTPVRMTVDLAPLLHRRLKGWTAFAARELDVADVPAVEVVRILIERLTMGPEDEDWNASETGALAHMVLEELRARQ